MNKISDFLDENKKFKCISCGACCSYITPLALNGKLPVEWLKPDGSCRNLINKKCLIYDTRPDICRIDKTLSHVSDYTVAHMCKVMKDFQDAK